MAKPDGFCNRAEAYEAHDDTPLSPAKNDAIGDVVLARYSRRDVMRGTLGVLGAASLFGPAALRCNTARAAPSAFDFEEINAGVGETHHLAPG